MILGMSRIATPRTERIAFIKHSIIPVDGTMIDFVIVHGNNSFLDYIDIVSWNSEEVKMDIIC